nr:MAG TPA: baseplate protein [Caudoviricetes sp.]
MEYVESFATTATQKAEAAANSAAAAENALRETTTAKTEAVQAIREEKTASLDAIADTKTAALDDVASSTKTATDAAAGATKQAQSSAASAAAAARSQTAAAANAQAAQTSAGAADASAKKAAEEARKAANYVAADKTLSVSGAPADAAVVGNIILDRTKETPQPIFYSKAEVDKLLEDCKEAAKRAALLAANPVGKLWVSDDPTSPASIVGGTWEQIASDRALMGASSTNLAGSTAEAGLPNVEGYFALGNTTSGAWAKTMAGTGPFSTTGKGNTSLATQYQNFKDATVSITFSLAKANSIYGNSATVQPPAYFTNIWRRVA